MDFRLDLLDAHAAEQADRMIEQVYRYAYPSALVETDGRAALRLAADNAATGDGPKTYLRARVREPEVTARNLRAVSEIVGARFYVPPSMLERTLREADPVATVSAGSVRFEGFSACCSAYIRLDLDADALETQERGKGTTNVDFGPDLRGALASVRRDSALELTIGAEAVGVVADGREVIEKKVSLPLRWLKGFAEVQRSIREMEPAFRLPRVGAQRFLRDLPRGRNDHRIWVTGAGPAARTSTREQPGAVPLRGSHRLRCLETLAGAARHLDAHVNRRTGASSWCLDFGTQRLWLVLNAQPWRGFSGDGGLLGDVARGGADGGIAEVRARLNWEDIVDVPSLAESTGLAPDAVEVALSHLAAAGTLGFDLGRGGYFHRVLPFRAERIETLNPRLKAARKLVEGNAVRTSGDVFEVRSEDVVHTVTATEDGLACTCPWFAANGVSRGPCKHALAVEIVLDE